MPEKKFYPYNLYEYIFPFKKIENRRNSLTSDFIASNIKNNLL